MRGLSALLCRWRGHRWRPFNPALPAGRSVGVCDRCGAWRPAAIRKQVIVAGPLRPGEEIPLGVRLEPGEELEVRVEFGIRVPPRPEEDA